MEGYWNNAKLKTGAKKKLEDAIANNMLSQDQGSIHGDQEYWNHEKGSAIGCISEISLLVFKIT